MTVNQNFSLADPARISTWKVSYNIFVYTYCVTYLLDMAVY